ncbi:MAG: dihydropyrimidinase [Candidatus Eisenbacteria bacterium]|uniref:Dihydropyrimidinase n=1 Tax=Eiseniibacteriota bacterium TaxID=2212470 RepID=A0A7Y2E8T8_UNCEI|nr:dihydropyrimidinase [Candidatus Eisenbacteria bacterium]
MSVLIKNGKIVNAESSVEADIFIDGETVTKIAPAIDTPADTVIDAKGKLVIPGGIDVHTHMELPFGGTMSSDDFATGTVAAAHGGTTTIVDFAVQEYGEALPVGVNRWREKAESKVAIDYSLHLIVRDFPQVREADMKELVNEGVTSFKLFMAYPGVFMVDDATIFRALRRSGDDGALICMHAENGGVIDELVKKALGDGLTAPVYHALTRPPEMEAEATGRAIALSEMAGVPIYIVHLSSSHALEKVREARSRGVPAYAETCPQYLFLSEDNYREPGFNGAKYVMSPPLRPKWHQDKLWKGLQDDDLQVVSTDHCPFCMKEGHKGLPIQKELGLDDFSAIPNGAPGVETRLMLLYDGGVRTGRISEQRWVQLVSTAPAKLMGLFPKKGLIAEGSDADIVIWDPNRETEISVKSMHMRCDYNPYEGRKVTGFPEKVLLRGKVVVDDGAFHGKEGSGEFVKRRAHSIKV